MQLKVGTKFASISILALCLMAITTTLGIMELGLLSDTSLRLATTTEASQYAHEMHEHLDDLYMTLDFSISQRNPARFGPPLAEPLAKVAQGVENLARIFNEQGAPQRAFQLTASHVRLKEEVAHLVQLAQSDQWAEASSYLINYIAPTRADLDGQIHVVERQVGRDVAAVTSGVHAARRSYLVTVLLEACAAVALLGLGTWLLWRNLVVPIRNLTSSAALLASGNLAARTNIAHRADEIGALATAFDSMAEQLEVSHHSLAEQVQRRTAELEAERAALQHALADLQSTTAEREQLLAALALHQNPVIPVIDGVVVAPIVGQLTSQRVEQLQTTLLDAVADTQARVALLDITGVPTLDAHSALRLLQTGSALRLLGATTILVGIRPEVAQTLVAQGTRIENIHSAIDLQRGIDLALRLLRRKIVPDHAASGRNWTAPVA